MLIGIVLLAKGVRSWSAIHGCWVVGLKISLRQIIRSVGVLLQVVESAALKFPPRWAAVGTMPTELLVNELWRNCSKLKKKNVLSWPL